jgi:hypothetical protein
VGRFRGDGDWEGKLGGCDDGIRGGQVRVFEGGLLEVMTMKLGECSTCEFWIL